MKPFRTTAIAAVVLAAVAACAQTPTNPSPATGRMAMMDDQMKAMCSLPDKLAKARTPDERKAVMSEHAKLMHDHMAMMNGMGGMQGDMTMRQQMMEKRMDMMQCSMQTMMDQMSMPGEKR